MTQRIAVRVLVCKTLLLRIAFVSRSRCSLFTGITGFDVMGAVSDGDAYANKDEIMEDPFA